MSIWERIEYDENDSLSVEMFKAFLRFALCPVLIVDTLIHDAIKH
jgi:hypothetical protein